MNDSLSVVIVIVTGIAAVAGGWAATSRQFHIACLWQDRIELIASGFSSGGDVIGGELYQFDRPFPADAMSVEATKELWAQR